MASPSIPKEPVKRIPIGRNVHGAQPTYRVTLTKSHVEALNRATDILLGLKDVMDPCQKWDCVWLILVTLPPETSPG